MALLAKNVPEGDGAAFKAKILQPELLDASAYFRVVLSGLANAREIALYVCSKHGHTDAAKSFGHDLQGDGFSGARGTRDKPVAVGKRRQQVKIFESLGGFCDE
jgi:hypothetical protein